MSGACAKLEAEFAARFGFAGAVATGFGRSALWLALRALVPEPRPNEQVLVPEFVCAQVPEAVRHAGLRPVPFPVERDLTIREDALRAALTPNTRAAIIVHHFGETLPNAAALAAICAEGDVPLIEDCALALSAGIAGLPFSAFGAAAVFSFTKADWCYGGGIVAAHHEHVAKRLREAAAQLVAPGDRLPFVYGLLRRADFLANRPRHAAAAERAGRWLERFSGLAEGNFFDAGRFDAAMPNFAATRALRVLKELEETTARRRQLLTQIRERLRAVAHILFRPAGDPHGAASFLPLVSPEGGAMEWRGRAAERGVTLRLCWPAYQALENAPGSQTLPWLAEHLLLLEVHPTLTSREVEQIAAALVELGQAE